MKWNNRGESRGEGRDRYQYVCVIRAEERRGLGEGSAREATTYEAVNSTATMRPGLFFTRVDFYNARYYPPLPSPSSFSILLATAPPLY